MDAQERLTVEEALAPTLLGSMHVHRYELAAELCRGLRVADIGCGSGYGSEILARESEYVLGIDVDPETVRDAEKRLGAPGRLEFEVADARKALRKPLRDRFDAIVMLETLEHLEGVGDVLSSLRRQADDGVRLVVSIPNSRMLDEENPFHVTDFGFDEATGAFEGFPDTRFVYQFLAEGSLLQDPDGDHGERTLVPGQGEPEYANQFIVLVNFSDRDVPSASALMRVQADPLHHRYILGLEQANDALLQANARLARGHLGTSDSAAATLVARVKRLESEVRRLERDLAEEKARPSRPEDQRRIAELDQHITDLNRDIAEMQNTRAWRLASSFWALKRRLRPGG